MSLTVWKPIETAPRRPANDELAPDILCWSAHGGYDVASSAWDEPDGSPVWFNGDVVIEPTHWMPLPEPPSCNRCCDHGEVVHFDSRTGGWFAEACPECTIDSSLPTSRKAVLKFLSEATHDKSE